MDYKNNLGTIQLIKKAVIPVAGQGTRLLPITRTQPKEMLPVFSSSRNGELLLKPIIQLIFEQLFTSGIRDFCFIVGKEKRIIELERLQGTVTQKLAAFDQATVRVMELKQDPLLLGGTADNPVFVPPTKTPTLNKFTLTHTTAPKIPSLRC